MNFEIKVFRLTFLVIVTIPALLILSLNEIPGRVQPSLDFTQKIYEGVVLEQDFKSVNNNLTAIGISIKNPNLVNNKDIILTIFDGDQILEKAVLNGFNIPDGSFVKFGFPALKQSKNNTYSFILTAPNVLSIEALEVFLSDSEQSISFVDFYLPQNSIYLIQNVYFGILSKLFADRFFALSYFSLIIILCICLIKAPKSRNFKT
ncbi:hypothetical protein C4577_07650 [Candidatus Parcubacteria bacterium]|nr:MAG: hypothetical protein C4577_07650 [Candidatus Parcubacteria bacterium]